MGSALPGTVSGIVAEALALVPQLTAASGDIIRTHFRRPIDVVDKADASPVTIADRDAEQAIRRVIAARFPDHGCIGEELGADRPDAEFVWVIDPIDGTKSFICGVPLFGTLIALLLHGAPVVGILDQPVSGERWVGAVGHPTLFNGAPCRVRACPSVDRAAIFTTAPELFTPMEADKFTRVRSAAKLVRYGTDCYAYGLVALGQIDAVIEAGLKLHDFAALVPIIQGAGGTVTGWRGEAAERSEGGRILATGDAALHQRLLETIA